MNCYCGHPKERHNHGEDEMGDEVRYGGNCKHCLCSEYGPKPKALEEVLLGVDSGPEGTCKLYGYRKDGVVHVTREKYSKPQEASEEKLAECDCNGMHEGNCPDPRVECDNRAGLCIPDEGLHFSECPAFKAKPQEEPKRCCCLQSDGKHMLIGCSCSCHQKETEPKEDPVTESDKKSVEEFEKNLDNSILDKPKSVDRWLIAASDIPKIKAFILKTRQEAREEVMNLPCMQKEPECNDPDWYGERRWSHGYVDGRNDIRREIRDALNKK